MYPWEVTSRVYRPLLLIGKETIPSLLEVAVPTWERTNASVSLMVLRERVAVAPDTMLL